MTETAHSTRRRDEETSRRARSLRKGDNPAEALLWNELKGRKLGGYKFVRQFPIGPYFADFLCRERKLVSELDGSQHAGSLYDENRNAFMRAQGYSVLRFWNEAVFRQRDEVCATILAALDGRLPEDVSTHDLRYLRGDDG
ncbi:MAG: DUF559 domain-containing protein [Aquamicrobium sp.]|uniref:endonuclease domain-containing protein n=1 Tax=Aquamicrobium sp. TaxID=1872579 RepID=UPI00349EA0AA|nr:DUF559 domain-containing protein [Aquamicrobium sp.]